MLFVKLSEVCRDEMRKVVGQPGDNFPSIPHPDEVSHVLELEAAVSGTAMNFVVFVALEVEPFPGPVFGHFPGKARRQRLSCFGSCVRGWGFGICFRFGVGFYSYQLKKFLVNRSV